MNRVVMKPRARADLLAHYEYIAEDNPDAADRFYDAVEAACIRLSRFP